MFVNVGHIKIQKFIQYQQGGSKLSFFRLFEIDFHVEPDSFQALKKLLSFWLRNSSKCRFQAKY